MLRQNLILCAQYILTLAARSDILVIQGASRTIAGKTLPTAIEKRLEHIHGRG
jgi:hypothetical protein